VADLPATVADTAKLLAEQGYIADQELATTVHLALAMRRPLFLEGEPGTGKRSPRYWQPVLGDAWCGFSATTGWICRQPPMNGTTRAN